jgi:hypothetical protein
LVAALAAALPMLLAEGNGDGARVALAALEQFARVGCPGNEPDAVGGDQRRDVSSTNALPSINRIPSSRPVSTASGENLLEGAKSECDARRRLAAVANASILE